MSMRELVPHCGWNINLIHIERIASQQTIRASLGKNVAQTPGSENHVRKGSVK